ncbi:uncharacterized protein EV154DRAFT_555773 [Mucor mucedo]|uniref:uncharacterized protein n=1 Tax=Mucor mucedo TaxID=29922 RepID=UPI00221EC5FE|nr:uncharacterized protein EV154DRAFT_555773 [Mucor mucedo]KAI7876145.1 hypothetical protein EV154DRAFT_555773 [Mucor mucedo]
MENVATLVDDPSVDLKFSVKKLKFYNVYKDLIVKTFIDCVLENPRERGLETYILITPLLYSGSITKGVNYKPMPKVPLFVNSGRYYGKLKDYKLPLSACHRYKLYPNILMFAIKGFSSIEFKIKFKVVDENSFWIRYPNSEYQLYFVSINTDESNRVNINEVRYTKGDILMIAKPWDHCKTVCPLNQNQVQFYGKVNEYVS